MNVGWRRLIAFYARRLGPGQRMVLAVLGAGMLGAALLEIISVALIAAFTAAVATSGQELSAVFPAKVATHLAGLLPTDFAGLVQLLAVAALLTLLVKNLVQAMNLYFLTRFAMQAEAGLGTELLLGFVRAPYLSVSARNAEDLAQTVRWRNHCGRQFLSGALGLASSLVVALALVAYLLVTMPVIAGGVIMALAVVALTVGRLLRHRIASISKRSLAEERAINRRAAGFIHGLRQMRISGGAERNAGEFERMATRFADTFALRQLALRAPSWLMEALGMMVLFVTVVLMVVSAGFSTADMTGIAALLVVTAWRLLRSAVEMQRETAKLRMAFPYVQQLVAEADTLAAHGVPETPTEEIAERLSGPIVLEAVDFNYPGAHRKVLDRVDLTIDNGSVVGIVGRSGEGKSTLADLLMGLFPPNAGQVRVGDVVLSEGCSKLWRNQVGYLCQEPYFIEGSLADNIAFGEAPEDIDLDRVAHSARMANVDFLEPGQDESTYRIGERGTGLSGGQKLRVGIARALYRSRELLILDEPTSALDHAASQVIRETLASLRGAYTVLVISHEMELLSACDKVAWLEDGRIRAYGPPSSVLPAFRQSSGVNAAAAPQSGGGA